MSQPRAPLEQALLDAVSASAIGKPDVKHLLTLGSAPGSALHGAMILLHLRKNGFAELEMSDLIQAAEVLHDAGLVKLEKRNTVDFIIESTQVGIAEYQDAATEAQESPEPPSLTGLPPLLSKFFERRMEELRDEVRKRMIQEKGSVAARGMSPHSGVYGGKLWDAEIEFLEKSRLLILETIKDPVYYASESQALRLYHYAEQLADQSQREAWKICAREDKHFKTAMGEWAPRLQAQRNKFETDLTIERGQRMAEQDMDIKKEIILAAEAMDEEKPGLPVLSASLLPVLRKKFPNLDLPKLTRLNNDLEQRGFIEIPDSVNRGAEGSQQIIVTTALGRDFAHDVRINTSKTTHAVFQGPVASVVIDSTGTHIGHIQQNVQQIGDQNQDLAKSLTELARLLTESTLPEDKKELALDAVEEISEQATKPPEEQKPSRVKRALDGITEAVQGSAELTAAVGLLVAALKGVGLIAAGGLGI